MLGSFGLDDFVKKILGFLLLAYIACEVSWNVAISTSPKKMWLLAYLLSVKLFNCQKSEHGL